jgi:hypothetical protein
VWVWIVGIAVVVAATIIAGAAVQTYARRHRQFAEVCRRWTSATPAGREEAMRSMLDASYPNGPAWYLCGCACLSQYRCKQAARAFGMAHHADSNLETAALLAFACLKASDGEASDLIEQITMTWDEMKRPDVLRWRDDRMVLDCLAATSGPVPCALSPLGRLTWLAVGPALRERLERLVASADERWAPLRR